VPDQTDVTDMWIIDAAGTSPWREVRYDGQPRWLRVLMQFAPTTDGVALAGVQIHRNDGRAVTSRDLRAVKIPPTWVLHGETAARWYGSEGTPIARRKGLKADGDERHRLVYDLWLQAQQVAPRAPVRWLLPHFGVSDATARRWIGRAKDRAAELGWPTTAQPAAQAEPASPGVE
jgi:hypothetical protein